MVANLPGALLATLDHPTVVPQQYAAKRDAAEFSCRSRATAGLRPILAVLVLTLGTSAMAIDLVPLWDFDRPDISEQRFRTALATASGDDALILQTQIARTYGLRGEFERARAVLKSLDSAMPQASAEARVRYALELGRTYASGTHPAESQTPQARELARAEYLCAFETAKRAQLDNLAIDALHMLALIDTAPTDQLKWGREALAVSQASAQPAARQWEASLRNNVGYALHQLGRYDEALQQFTLAVALRERGTNAQATRVAYWMVAWTLRAMGRTQEALDIQLRLERERDAAGTPSPYVFEELELLYRSKGDTARADAYAARKMALSK